MPRTKRITADYTRPPTGGSPANYVAAHDDAVAARHYLIRSSAHPRRWAAFSPRKVMSFRERWNDNFCLVVLGALGVPDDFYAIPWKEVAHLFIDENDYPAPSRDGRVTNRWQIHLEGPPHHFQFELAKGDSRPRPRFDASRWYGNRHVLEIPSAQGGPDVAAGSGVAPEPILPSSDPLEPSFTHSQAFPIIASVICRTPPDVGEYVSHERIVSALLADTRGSVMVVQARVSTSWDNDAAAASNMVAWFSQRITQGRSAWANLFERLRIDGAWAYRPIAGKPPNPDHDVEQSSIEGEPRLVAHFRRERDPRLAEAKRRAVGAELNCEACGLIAQAAYPGLPGDVYEVHHRLPLSNAHEPVTTKLADLAILCANCHRAIHRTSPLMTVEEFRAIFVRQGSR